MLACAYVSKQSIQISEFEVPIGNLKLTPFRLKAYESKCFFLSVCRSACLCESILMESSFCK